MICFANLPATKPSVLSFILRTQMLQGETMHPKDVLQCQQSFITFEDSHTRTCTHKHN